MSQLPQNELKQCNIIGVESALASSNSSGLWANLWPTPRTVKWFVCFAPPLDTRRGLLTERSALRRFFYVHACRVRLPTNNGSLDGQPCDGVLEGLDGAGEVAIGAVGWHDVGVAAELEVGGVREVDRRLRCGHKGQRCTKGVRVAQNIVKGVVAHHHTYRGRDEQRLVCRILHTPQTESASIRPSKG